MAKIVCEVCGAAYPETSSRCPVCGSVHYGTPEPVSDVVVTEQEKERPAADRSAKANAKSNAKKRRKHGKKNTKVAQYIAIGVAIVLLIALLVVLLLSGNNGAGNNPTTPTTEVTDPPTEPPTEVLCNGISLDVQTHTFAESGAALKLIPTCDPADTTEPITFVSSDPTVITVDRTGNVVAVGPGTATVTVTCGTANAVCEFICDWQDATEAPTLPPETLVLNRSDFTLAYKGAFWQLYDGVIDINLITFSSDNDAVATFVAGKVTAVGRGTTTVHAEFGGQKVSCIVRCSFKNDTTSEGNGGVEEDNGTTGSTTKDIVICSQFGKVAKNQGDGYGDVSLKVGEKLQLFLRDGNGEKIVVEWKVSKEGVITINGSEITADAKGTVILTATHDGTEYKCYVRVN